MPRDENDPAVPMRGGEGACGGRIGELQVERVAESAAGDGGELLSGCAGHPDEARFGEPRRMGVGVERRRLERSGDGDPDDLEGRADRPQWPGARARPSAGTPDRTRPSTRTEPTSGQVVQTDAVPDLETEKVGEAALDDHAAVAHPMAGGELRLVDRRGGEIPPFGHHWIGVSVDDEVRHRDQVRPARGDDARCVLEVAELRGKSRLLDGSDDVRPGGCRSGRRVRRARHAVQGEGNCERGRRGGDRDEEQQRFGPIATSVLCSEPDD